MHYTHEYSNFPEALISIIEYEDVNDIAADMLNTIKQYQKEGKYDAAGAYIKKNKEFLQKHLIGADTIMKLQEEIRNTQIYGLSKGQNIYYQNSEPETIGILDTWIGNAAIQV